MIKLGYNNKLYVLLRTAIAFLIGGLFLFKPNSLDLIVEVIGIVLIGSGIISLISGLIKKDSANYGMVFFNAIINVGLGIILYLKADLVINYVTIFIGIALLIFGALQLFIMLVSSSYLKKVSPISIIFNIVILMGGLVLCFNPESIKNSIEAIAGILLVLYGISEAISLIRLFKAEKAWTKNNEQEKEDKNFKYGTVIQEAEFEKVEDDSSRDSR